MCPTWLEPLVQSVGLTPDAPEGARASRLWREGHGDVSRCVPEAPCCPRGSRRTRSVHPGHRVRVRATAPGGSREPRSSGPRSFPAGLQSPAERSVIAQVLHKCRRKKGGWGVPQQMGSYPFASLVPMSRTVPRPTPRWMRFHHGSEHGCVEPPPPDWNWRVT